MIRTSLIFLITSLILVAPSSTCRAGLLGTANNDNIFTLGDFVQTGTDSLGRIAVGGKFDPGGTLNNGGILNGSGSYSIATNNPTTGGYANLVVGGNYRNGSTTVNGNVFIGGTAYVAGTVNGTLNVVGDLVRDYGQQNGNVLGGHDVTYTGPSGSLASITARNNLVVGGGGSFTGNVSYGGTFTNNDSYKFYSGTATRVVPAPAAPTLPINFANEAASLKSLSHNLDALASTGTVVFTGGATNRTTAGMTITGTHANQDVVHLNAADLAYVNSLTINGVAGETIVINVDGPTASFGGFQIYENGVDKQHILFNFANGGNAISVTSNNLAIDASVLAPTAAFNFAGGHIDGTLIANTLQGAGESHDFAFLGSVAFPGSSTSSIATPAPATLASAWLGAILAAAIGRRRRRSA